MSNLSKSCVAFDLGITGAISSSISTFPSVKREQAMDMAQLENFR